MLASPIYIASVDCVLTVSNCHAVDNRVTMASLLYHSDAYRLSDDSVLKVSNEVGLTNHTLRLMASRSNATIQHN